ncbi:RNA-binding RNA annealing protein [Rhodotorula toruloides]
MRVEIVVDPARAAAKQPLTARIAAAAPQAPANSRAAQSATVAAAGGSAVQTRQPRQPGQGGRRGGRRGGGRGGARGSERPKVTAESLDAEMSDYQAQGAGANGAAEASA